MNLFQRAGSFDFIGNTDKDRCPITEWVELLQFCVLQQCKWCRAYFLGTLCSMFRKCL